MSNDEFPDLEEFEFNLKSAKVMINRKITEYQNQLKKSNHIKLILKLKNKKAKGT